MPAPQIARELPPWVHRKRPDMSEAHKALIRRLPCVVCGAACVDPHHLMRTGDSDKWLLPELVQIRPARAAAQ